METLQTELQPLSVGAGAEESEVAVTKHAPSTRARLVLPSVAVCAVVAACVCWGGPLAGRGGSAKGAGFALHAVETLDDARTLSAERTSGRYVRWKMHLDKCLDVWGDHAGAQVQLWSCNDFQGAGVRKEAEFKWILPRLNEPGPIVWAGNTTYCLNAPEGNGIQIWYCETAPVQHTRWKITSDGRIHLAYNFGKCLDIPGGDKSIGDGIKVQLWDCLEDDTSREGNVLFDVYPQDCHWSPWSAWSPCSKTCGGGTMYMARRVERPSVNGGHACVGPSTKSAACNEEKCEDGEERGTLVAAGSAGSGEAGAGSGGGPAEGAAEAPRGGPCYAQGSSWEPLDMRGEGERDEESNVACQDRCAQSAGCAHFSYWPNGGCHLQDGAATQKEDSDVWSGPRQCQAGTTKQKQEKQGGGGGLFFR